MNKRIIHVIIAMALISTSSYIISGCTKGGTVSNEPLTKVEDNIAKSNKEKNAKANDQSLAPSGYGKEDPNSNNLNDNYSESELGSNVGESEKSPSNNTPPVEVPQTNPIEQPITTPETTPVVPDVPSSSGVFMGEVEQIIFQRVNEERAKAGVAPLSYNSTMELYGRIKSQDMGDRDYFDHKNPEGELITAQMQRDGVSYSAWGENIAYRSGITTATEVANSFMTNWMNSTGHRENILSNNFSGIGVGVYNDNGTIYATQEFYR